MAKAKLTRDDGRDVEVYFTLESAGEPNCDSPGNICDGGGEPPTWLVECAEDAAGNEETLTDAERERFEAWACENLEPPAYEPQEDDVF
jgi:hypothetical protein